MPPPPPLFRSPDATALPGTRYGFFGRKGGVSTIPYDSLNCSPGSGDNKERVLENRARAVQALGHTPDQLASVWQDHTTNVVEASLPQSGSNNRPKADALVTQNPEIGLGILTADCLPVLFSDPVAKVIGAAHAGWRGLFDGILEATLAAMETIGANRSQIHALVGPAIHQEAYETGVDFYLQATELDPNSENFFSLPEFRNRRHFTLPDYALTRLKSAGTGTAANLGVCVYDRPDEFFSCRRASHRGHMDYGRQISIIFLNPTS